VTTAWRKALDRLRREVVGREKVAAARPSRRRNPASTTGSR
jgi:hypothetical protein